VSSTVNKGCKVQVIAASVYECCYPHIKVPNKLCSFYVHDMM